MTTNDYLVKAFQSLGQIIDYKDTEISLLQYEKKKLEEKIKSIEEHINSYYEKEEKRE